MTVMSKDSPDSNVTIYLTKHSAMVTKHSDMANKDPTMSLESGRCFTAQETASHKLKLPN